MNKKEVQKIFSRKYIISHPYDKIFTDFQEAYAFLRTSYRNEYFYKNTIFNRHVVGKRSTRTTTALQELPIASSIADFILINGNAVVYEIKSEVDSFDRLASQLEDYYKVFGYVYLVTNEEREDIALNILKDTPTGLYVLRKNEYLSECKEAIWNDTNFSSKDMFQLMRKYEFENILKDEGFKLPNVPPAFYYKACYKIWLSIPVGKLHRHVIKQLKLRKKTDFNYKKIAYEVRSLYYFYNLENKIKENV